MDSKNTNQGTRAERLTQLADLHRQGVLSAQEYEAAVARLVQATTAGSLPIGAQELAQGSTSQAGEEATRPRTLTDSPNDAASTENRTKKVGLLITGGVALVLLMVVLVVTASGGGDQKACDLFGQANQRPSGSATWFDMMSDAEHAASDPDLIDAISYVENTFGEGVADVEVICSSLGAPGEGSSPEFQEVGSLP